MKVLDRNRHLLMVLCCLIPLAALGAIFLLRVPASSALVFALILLCPLSHLLLMGPAGHEHGAMPGPQNLASSETQPRQPAGSPTQRGQDVEPST